MTEEKANSPNVIMPPPLLFGGAILLGLIIDLIFGWHLPMPLFARCLLGIILIGLGVVPGGSAAAALRAANTPLPTWQPTRQIVTNGPYKFSRNPIYIGLVLIYLGLVIVLGSGAGIVLLLPVLALLHFGIVLREEAYLSEKFGAMYKNYCKTTPRWLQ